MVDIAVSYISQNFQKYFLFGKEYNKNIKMILSTGLGYGYRPSYARYYGGGGGGGGGYGHYWWIGNVSW